MKTLIVTLSCLLLCFSAALAEAPPMQVPRPHEDHTQSPHTEALSLVFTTQQKVIAGVDAENWWHDVKERQWLVKRSISPGTIDSTHLFEVIYRIEGKDVASWFVDTRKLTADRTAAEDSPISNTSFTGLETFRQHASSLAQLDGILKYVSDNKQWCALTWFSHVEGVGYGNALIYRYTNSEWRLFWASQRILSPDVTVSEGRAIISAAKDLNDRTRVEVSRVELK